MYYIRSTSILENIVRNSFDKFFSALAIFITLPIVIFIAYRIKRASPDGPVFFIQERLGLKGSKFKILKFRTMHVGAEQLLDDLLRNNTEARQEYKTYKKLKSDPRIISGIGPWIRRNSLDELPQFINVLKGDMSLVGPRPYIDGEFSLKNRQHKRDILSVKPGMTGYWQIQDRNNATFDKRVESDLIYLKKRSFFLDLKIVLKTFLVFFKNNGGAF